MSAPFGSLICDDYGTRCDCCERLVRRTLISRWHTPDQICSACFAVWYDSGSVEREDIRRIVLEAERDNVWPFGEYSVGGGERVPE